MTTPSLPAYMAAIWNAPDPDESSYTSIVTKNDPIIKFTKKPFKTEAGEPLHYWHYDGKIRFE